MPFAERMLDPENQARVLVVEDEALIAAELRMRLTDHGYTVQGPVASGEEALRLVAREEPDIILMDIRIKGPLDGIETAERILAAHDIPIVFATSYSDEVTIERANRLDPEAIVFKPFDDKEIREVVRLSVRRRRAQRRLRESEARYRELFENNVAGVFQCNSEGRLMAWNRAMAGILGVGEDSGGNNANLCLCDMGAGDLLGEVRTSGRVAEREVRLTREDGTAVWVAMTLGMPENGLVTGTAISISRLKDLEHRLNEQLTFVRTLMETIPVPVYFRDTGGVYRACNSAFERFFDRTREEIIGKTVRDLSPPWLADTILQSDAKLFQRPGVDVYESVTANGHGEERLIGAYKATLCDEDGTVRGVVGVLFDRTDQEKVARTLKENEEKFRLISENVHDLLTVIDPRGVILYASPSAAQFGYDHAALAGGRLAELLHEDDREVLRRILTDLLANHRSRIITHRLRDHAGGWRRVETSIGLLINDGEVSLLAVTRDVTERLSQQEELQALRHAIDQSPVAVVMTDPGGTITYVNPAFTGNSGYAVEEAVGRTPAILRSGVTDPGVYRELWQTILNGRNWHGTLCNRKKDGSLYWERSTITPVVTAEGGLVRFIAIKEDISDHVRRSQEQASLEQELRNRNAELERTVSMLHQTQDALVQSEKLASIGQLTAGIAHEINNPLAFVLSNLNRISEYFEDVVSLLSTWRVVGRQWNHGNGDDTGFRRIDEEERRVDLGFVIEDHRRLLDHTRSGAGRIKGIVDQLRGFTHLSGNGYADTDLNEALEETVAITWNELKYRAKIVREFGQLPVVSCNAGEIKQVLVNLIVNAAHAMDGEGILTLRTRAGERDAVIEIEDTGHGIHPAHLKRIFDPFFTTKPVGRGTGLGLWISNTIIRKHHGTIAVRSVPGKGSQFTVRIPFVQPEHLEEAGHG